MPDAEDSKFITLKHIEAVKEALDVAAESTDLKLATKQDVLASGENIKTIDGYEVLGSGDINLRYCRQVDSGFYRDAYFYLPNEWEVWLTAEPAPTKTWDQFLNALGITTTATSIFVYVAHGDPFATQLYHTHAYMITKTSGGIYNNRARGTLYTPFKTYYDTDGVYMWSTYGIMRGTAIYSSNTSPLIKIAGIETPDLTNYYTKTETDTLLGAKQATLVSGTNIKTVNNNSLLGSGNITIDKAGIGLGSVDNTSDLNKPISTATQNALNKKSSRMSIYGSLPTDTSTPVSIELTEDERYLIRSGAIDLLLVHDDDQGLTYAFKKMLDYPEEGDYSFYYHKHFGTTSDDRYMAKLETGTFEIRKVDSAHDSSKQDTLVSGTNIKTINGQSLLGSGDIALNVVYFEPDA